MYNSRRNAGMMARIPFHLKHMVRFGVAAAALTYGGVALAEDQSAATAMTGMPIVSAEVVAPAGDVVTAAWVADAGSTGALPQSSTQPSVETLAARDESTANVAPVMPVSFSLAAASPTAMQHPYSQMSPPDLSRFASSRWEEDFYGSQQQRYGLLDTGDAQLNAAVYGPVDAPAGGSDGTLDNNDARYNTIGGQIGAVKWEALGIAAYITATNMEKLIRVGGRGFSFQDEGWFGLDTHNLGVDKLSHAYNAYLFSEIFYHRIRHRVGDRPNVALTGALLGWGVQFFGEVFDGFKTTSGFSVEDLITNTAGAGFSYLRNAVPGLRDKVDFRVLIMPNSDFYSIQGKRHYEQQRFMLAFTLAGFRQFENTPLRFLELHVGYHASGFTAEAVANGERMRRHVFVGVGLNLNEILFGSRPRTGLGRAASAVFDYLQIPYTAVHF